MEEEVQSTTNKTDDESLKPKSTKQEPNLCHLKSLKWKLFKNREDKSSRICLNKENNIIQEICATILNTSSSLRITSIEATNLLTSLIDKNQLLEKIKKIEIEREPYRLEHNLKFKKYFEVVAHNGIIERICYDNGSRFAFTGGADGIIKCWCIVSGMLVKSLYGHANMISDLCISRNGEYMVSVDYQGLMNIWSLKTLSIIHSIQFSSEAIFCEFIYPPDNSSVVLGSIFIIFSDGMVKLVEFDNESISAKLANSFMFGESIKAICITDGGRFVICGGWWPFFLIYDTCDLNKIIVAENFRIQTICAAKNALKFAASSENRIHIYTFYSENSSVTFNYSRKKPGTGFWKRNVNEIDKEYFVEWICFLPSYLLVAACTDSIIRIYEDDSLIFSFAGESGTIYSHPFKNIFAIVGTNLSIYQLSSRKIYSEYDFLELNRDTSKNIRLSNLEDDFRVTNSKLNDFNIEKIFSEMIHVNLNDCQFSDDGKFFITCDDQGIIKTYSIEDPINVPEQQFFLKDIDREIPEENYNETYNIYRQKNIDWIKFEYHTSEASINTYCIQIENQASKTLERDKLTEEKFKALYLSGDVQETQKLNDEFNRSSFSIMTGSERDETYILSEDSEKSVDTKTSSTRYTNRSLSSSSDKSSKSRRRRRKNLKLKNLSNLKPSEFRRIIDSNDTDELKQSNRKKRKLIISESDDDSPVVVQRLNYSNFNRSSRILRRNLIESADENSSEFNRQKLSNQIILRRNLKEDSEINTSLGSSFLPSSDFSIGEIRRPTRSASVMNQLKLKSESNFSLKSSKLNSYSSDSDQLSSSSKNLRNMKKSRRKLLRSNNKKSEEKDNNSSRKNSKSQDSYNLLASSDSGINNSNSKILRRHFRSFELNSNSSNTMNNSSKRQLRRDLTTHSPILKLQESFSDIDEEFESELCIFAQNWLASCSIYPNTKIYFNKTHYEEFMKLDQRINYLKKYPSKSGFYTVKDVKFNFIGRIPYLILILDSSQIIKFYEYPTSNGIICTADQYILQKGQFINLFKKSKIIQNLEVLDQDEMFIIVDNQRILKSLALVKYKSLGFEEIPYSKTLKLLFLSFLSDKFKLKVTTNFDLINKKLNFQLYEKHLDFLFDLNLMVNAASEISDTAQNEVKAILESYENKFNN